MQKKGQRISLFVCFLVYGVLSLPLKSNPNDEGENNFGEKNCIECLLNRIAVPDDFSGDLNELAELSYHTDKPQINKYGFDDDYIKNYPNQVKPVVRPELELIGGYGIKEEEEEEQPSKTVDVSNLEIGEGLGKLKVEEKIDLKSVKHKSDILSEDSKLKEDNIAELKEILTKLKSEKAQTEEEIQKYKTFQESEIETLKYDSENMISQAKEEFDHKLLEVKSEGSERVERVHEEEQRIHERKQLELKLMSDKLKKKLQDDIERATTELHQAEAQSRDARKRAQEVTEKDPSWKSFSKTETHSLSLRKTLIDMKTELEKLKEMDSQEEQEVQELTAQLRDEEKSKEVLNSRLKQLNAREQALKEKEKSFEVMNANLRHQVDENESQAEDNAEFMAHAREAIVNSLPNAVEKAEEVVAEKEKEFQSLAMKSAQDEISRLKEKLEKKERRESHEEELLIQQEKEIQENEVKAEEIAQEATKELKEGESQVEQIIRTAVDEAKQILAKAEKDSKHAYEVGKAEETDVGKEEREKTIREQKSNEMKIKRAEEEAKRAATIARSKMEQQINFQESQIKKELEKETSEIKAELEKETEKEVESVKQSYEEKFNDVNADIVMAKIHKTKNDKEIEQIRKENELIQKEIKSIEKQTQIENQEWAFQQLAQSQRPVFVDEGRN